MQRYLLNPWAPAGRTADRWSIFNLTTDPNMPAPPTIVYNRGTIEVRGTGAAVANSDRRDVLVPPDAPQGRNSRIRSVWWGPKPRAGATSALRPQHGHVHRLAYDPSTGRTTAVVAWHDILFGLPNVMNCGVLSGVGTSTLTQGTPNALLGNATFTDGSRTSNVVTLTGVTVGHGLGPGDVIVVDATVDNTYDGTFTVTSSTATTITYGQVAANDASAGAGAIRLPTSSVAGQAGVFRSAPVSAGSRTSQDVTLTVPSGHPFTAGSVVTVDVATASYDGVFSLLGVTDTTVSYTQAAADDPTAGAGTVSAAFPFLVESTLIEDAMMASLYALRPSSTLNFTAGVSTPATPASGDLISTVGNDIGEVANLAVPSSGPTGLMVGHLCSTTMARFDSLSIQILDGEV